MSIDMTHYDPSNVFAKILAEEIPCEPIYEDAHVLAFDDISKAAPVHVLVIPKGNYISFNDFVSNVGSDEIAGFFERVRLIASDILGLEADGYRIITNHGANAAQTVGHFHVHILGGKALGGLLPSDTMNR